ncbi:MAG: SH3 domain protein [Bacteriovoracaceae bacterium]|jgi:SH3 domain protein
MKVLLALTIALVSINSIAATNYITGVQKVTFRTGPGTDNKIIRMLETDSKVETMEVGETWTKVKDANGDEGFVLSRFLVKDTPYKFRYEWLKNQHEKLKEKYAEVSKRNGEYDKELTGLKTELDTAKGELSSTAQSYTELKEGSTDFIGLKKKYDSTLKNLNAQTAKVEDLESKISIYYIKWFLAGGGVLFLGWLIGLMSRKKKSYSGLSL